MKLATTKRKVQVTHHFSHTPPRYHDSPTMFHCWCGQSFIYDHSAEVLREFMDWLNDHAACGPKEGV